jgi:uncharacterized protein DUF6483
MIRRDYVLRMIEEFIQVLARIKGLKQGQKLEEAEIVLDDEFNRLVGAGPLAVAQLSDTELLAKLMAGESTQVIHQKALLLTRLLQEAGDLAADRVRRDESRACYLKGLHVLLGALASSEVLDCPDFVPKVDWFVEVLEDEPLPIQTHALLMQHYERSGQFGKAEDALFAILEAQPDSAEVLEFGIKFYERAKNQSDAALAEGNLPRAEVESGLAELRRRRAGLTSSQDP